VFDRSKSAQILTPLTSPRTVTARRTLLDVTVTVKNDTGVTKDFFTNARYLRYRFDSSPQTTHYFHKAGFEKVVHGPWPCRSVQRRRCLIELGLDYARWLWCPSDVQAMHTENPEVKTPSHRKPGLLCQTSPPSWQNFIKMLSWRLGRTQIQCWDQPIRGWPCRINGSLPLLLQLPNRWG